jgi:hypothetical protein
VLHTVTLNQVNCSTLKTVKGHCRWVQIQGRCQPDAAGQAGGAQCSLPLLLLLLLLLLGALDKAANCFVTCNLSAPQSQPLHCAPVRHRSGKRPTPHSHPALNTPARTWECE